MHNDVVHDFVAVGVGPFNLGLACLSSALADLRCVFLDREEEFNWHPGMLIDGVTLQSPFLADLVSMADPTNPFSYLNYRKQQGSLFNFFVRENYYLERQEYNRYCRWAVSRLDNIRFNHNVERVVYDPEQRVYRVIGFETKHKKPFSFLAKKLVIGVGMKPRIPDCFRSIASGIDLHSSRYLQNKPELQKKKKKITVIGGGQSGAEIFYDLLKDSEHFGYQLDWVTRAPRFFQMETAKLTLEILCGDYGTYFHALDQPTKQKIIEEQKSVYCGANQALIDKIYDFLDAARHSNLPKVQLMPCMNLISVEPDNSFQNSLDNNTDGFFLQFAHTQTGKHYQTHTEGLVLSSGHLYEVPPFMEGVFDRIERDKQGKYLQKENWSVDIHGREIFIQNAGFESHGLINQDLGMSCYRNSRILREITGRDIYPIENRFAFQSFEPGKESDWNRVSAGVPR